MSGKKATIILCEDENLIALDIRNQLHQLGYKVLKICNSGEELIRSAEELKPDIIVTDIHLRGKISGIEAARIINRRLHIPFIYLSGQKNPATYSEAMKTNPADFISKPFSLEQLNNALNSCRNVHFI